MPGVADLQLGRPPLLRRNQPRSALRAPQCPDTTQTHLKRTQLLPGDLPACQPLPTNTPPNRPRPWASSCGGEAGTGHDTAGGAAAETFEAAFRVLPLGDKQPRKSQAENKINK